MSGAPINGFFNLTFEENNMKNYRKTQVQPMRHYFVGEDMTGISIAEGDTPEAGGMVAVNPKDKTDRWYVAKQFFEDNYELVD